MYIEKVRIKNVRCFNDVTLDLRGHKTPRKWATIVGDNGCGKTTLLRCIAMGLCDRAGAAALIGDTYGEWRSNYISNKEDSFVRIDLYDQGKPYHIHTRFIASDSGLETINQKTEPSINFPWNRIFVCGYGANRRNQSTQKVTDYYTADAVYTLFNYDFGLKDPELALRRLSGMGKNANSIKKLICNWISSVLMLEKNSINLSRRGMTIVGPWGKDVYLGSLADGYEATLSWLLDLISWNMFTRQTGKNKLRRKPRGIVLLDELEQYLHPKWQSEIVARLHNVFPNIQFICTTHSPIRAAGTLKVPYNNRKMLLLERGQNETVQIIDDLPHLEGLSFDQILASRVFGYIIDTNPETQKILEEASILAGKGLKRSVVENRRYNALKRKIPKNIPFSGLTLAQREIQKNNYNLTKKEVFCLEKKLFGNKK